MVPKKTRRARGVKKKRPAGLCAAIVACSLFLLLQSRLYGLEPDAYRGLLALQLPFLYALAPAASPAPSAPPVQASVDQNVGESFRMELTRIESAPRVDLSGDGPRILIYHTHASEAYRPTAQSAYEASGDFRTHDNEKNIVAVGRILAEELRERYGFNVIHDVSDYEPPKLSTAYSRSLVAMRRYREAHPSVTMFIDVHRDAWGTSGGEKDYVVIDGKETARMMFVVGTGEGATGNGFDEMPDFAANYALAAAVTERLQTLDGGLMRDIRVKTGRYNQHVSSQCLLVEIGHNQNTLEQAQNAAVLLAAAIAETAEAPRRAP